MHGLNSQWKAVGLCTHLQWTTNGPGPLQELTASRNFKMDDVSLGTPTRKIDSM